MSAATIQRIISIMALVLVMMAGHSLGQGRNAGAFQFEERSSKYTAKIVIRTRAFVRSQHTLTFADKDYLRRKQISLAKGVSLLTKIDGRAPLGTDGTIPQIEIASMTVSFNGAKIVVPRSLYADCYNPNLQKDTFATKLNDAGDSLLIFMAGSDAAGSYQVMWILRNDGHHSRFVKNCSDCDYSGVLDFFSKQ